MTAAILNDDKTVLTLTGPAPTEEGTGGTTAPLVFQVALSAPVQGGFQLAYTTDDATAKTIDSDYVDNDGQLVFNGTANETRAITVQVQQDTVLERDENLAVTLRSVLGIDPSMADDITFAVSTVSATILNDDDTTLTLSQPEAIAEGTGGDFTEVLAISCLLLSLTPWKAQAQGNSVAAVAPPAGATVSNLTVITVTFDRPVVGVQAEDIIISGNSATSVTGDGAVYSFHFDPPGPGTVEGSWNGGHNILDLSGTRLNDLGANTIWEYTLIDIVKPVLTDISPAVGSTLGHFTQVNVTFGEFVAGVGAADLLVNGQPAPQVVGQGSGPYTFTFPTPTPGLIQMSWAPNHGIRDLAPAPNTFPGGNWTYIYRPEALFEKGGREQFMPM